MGRFTQAISEGDGISVVPVLEGDVGELAALAEATTVAFLAAQPEDHARVRVEAERECARPCADQARFAHDRGWKKARVGMREARVL